MAKAIFIFDHIYPVDSEGNVYYSSGFDEDFFDRYYHIFDKFNIWGRKKVISPSERNIKVSYPSKFYLTESNKKIWKIKSKLRLAIEEVDCVVARMPSIFGALAISIAKKVKKPYIVEIVSCEYDALSVSPSLIRRVLAYPTEWFYRGVLKNNPYSIYVTKEFLQNKYPSRGKQVAISNVTIPDMEECVLQERLERIRTFDKKKRIVIGTCSTLNVDFKGQQYVIRAIPLLKEKGYDVEYQLVGDGNGSWLLDIAKQSGVEADVRIIGHLDHSEVFKWLDAIDLYVHPSCQEGLSRAVIEAMSRACPVIGADTGGIHELIDKTYIVPKRDSQAIANGIEKMIDGDLESQSLRNFNTAKEYLKIALYKKREDFYGEFLKEYKLI